MRPVSARFQREIAQSRAPTTRATLLPSGVELPIQSGTVTLNANAEVRASAELELADDGALGLVPTDSDSPLAPFGNEIRIERGLTYQSGADELVAICVARIERATVSDTGDGLAIRVSGLDRAQKYIDAQFEAPYQVAAATNAIDAIETVLREVDADAPFALPASAHTTPLLVAEEGEDRWAFAQGIARAIGGELYHDGDGVLTLAPVLQTATSVATVAEGDGGVLLSLDAEWDRTEAFNRVIVTAESSSETGPVLRGCATDDADPTSPTYYYGPFGRKPMLVASEFVTTEDQANTMAEALLAKNLGITKAVDFGSLVLPHLEPYDAITITRERAGVAAELHVLDSLTIPLSASDAMSCRTRAVRVTS